MVMVLNYNDACLYDSDVALIQNPRGWLNSSCIHFQLMRLQSSFDVNRIHFMDPSALSFFIQYCKDSDDIADFCNGLDLKSKTAIVLPINSTFAPGIDCAAGGGTHWSLLVIIQKMEGVKNMRHAFHLDSAQGMNTTAAQNVAKRFYGALLEQHHSVEAYEALVTECRIPQQNNGYDCGVFTLIAADFSAQAIFDHLIKCNDIRVEDDWIRIWKKIIENSIERVTNVSDCATLKRKQIVDDIVMLASIKEC